MGSRGSVIVVGAGIAGLSAAWALERRGFEVTVFEQGPIPNPRASSYDEHRVTRYAYGPFEGYAYMMPRAYAMFERLFEDIGANHYAPVGVAYFMRDSVDWFEPVMRTLGELEKWVRDVPLDEVRERFPLIRPEGLTKVVESEGGMLFPIRILTDLAVLLGNRGVTLHGETKVSAVDPESGTVVADGHEHRADRVVIAAGAWLGRLTDLLEDTVVPSRQAVMYVAPPPELAKIWSRSPVQFDLGSDNMAYGLPSARGTRFKIGDHVFTRSGDPDEDRAATARDLERLHGAARRTFVDFERYQVLERKTCYYTVTRDDSERFSVVPWGSKAFVISACSGHGFKLGPLIGDGVAATIADEVPPDELTRWAAGRGSLEECRDFASPTLEAAR